MKIVTGPEVADFVGGKLGTIIYPPFTCMGIEKDGEICGGVVMNCYTGTDVHFTVAGSGWSRPFLREWGNYVFNQLGCLRATAITEQDHVIDLATRMGCCVEGILRDQFGEGRNGTILGVLKKDFRFK